MSTKELNENVFEAEHLKILQIICEEFRISLQELLSVSRLRSTTDARLIGYKVFRDRGLKYADIGKIFGRNHTSVIKGLLYGFPSLLLINELKEKYNNILNKINT